VSNNKVRVSLCMIVRNEEENLAACLDPVASLFDEIVIVDTGSTDATREIARHFTPCVYDFPWCDDFSAARNESLRHASGDWIFWLDADDRIRPPQVERLRRVIEQLDDRPRVMRMETVLLPPTPQDEPEHTSHARLFRRHSKLHWRGRVHEQLWPDFATLGYECVFTDVQIEHLGYMNQAITFCKLRRKLRLLRMDYAVNPSDSSTLFHLGMSLMCMRQFEEAQAILCQLTDSEIGSSDYSRWSFNGLSRLSLSAGKPKEALRFASRGLLYCPNDGPLLFSQANAFFTLENYNAAAGALEQLISTSETRAPQFNTPALLRTKLAPRMLGSVLRLLGRFSEAETTLVNVLRDFPTDAKTLYHLGLLYLDLRNPAALGSMVTNLFKIPGGSFEAGLLAALWHIRQGNPSLAGPIIENLIEMEPHAPVPRMLRAEWLSKMHAPWDEKIRALRDILRIQPENIEAQRWIDRLMEVRPAAAPPVLCPTVAPANPFAVTG
jgi:tetratricopeptide (TPR) repeat protein